MENKLNNDIDYKTILPKIKVSGVSIPAEHTSSILEKLKGKVLDMKGIKPISKGSNGQNTIFIDPAVDIKQVKDLINDDAPIIADYEVQTHVENLNYQDILKLIFPKDLILPSSFETIGHIAFLNLRPIHYPYKYLIGKAIIDTNKRIRTVVNKYDKLENQFRTPALELIAGQLNYETTVMEEKAKLHLNVEQVYFCSRLHYERSRVLAEIAPASCIVDVFCGVGPFAIRAAKEKQCTVLANDLNPECFKYLQINIKENKLAKWVQPFCMDGRDFIHTAFEKVAKKEIEVIHHFYMNLPGLAIEFLDAFNNVDYKSLPFESFKVHVYCFQAKEENEETVIEKVKQRILMVASPIQKQIVFNNFNVVKNVSTKKTMLCVTFQIKKPEGEAIPQPQQAHDDASLSVKKIKIETLEPQK